MAIFSAGSASVQIVPDFSGAQTKIGEWFARQGDLSVKVKPDLSQADLEAAKAEIDSTHANINVGVDKNTLSSSIATGIQDAMGMSGLDKIGSLVNAAVAPAMMASAVGMFTELAAVAGQAVGVIALAPAALLALGAPLAVLKLGLTGVGQAFKDAFSGNVTALQKDLQGLAPAAQQFVLQVSAMKPAFDNLRLDVQQSLFAGLGTAVSNLAGVALPILKTGLSAVAADMNAGLLATFHALASDGAQFTTIFGNIAVAGRSMAGAMAPLVQSFVTIAAVGSQFLPQLAADFEKAAVAANDWVQKAAATGQLTKIIGDALTVLEELVKALINVGSIVAGILQAALPFGDQLLKLLVALTGQLATFIHSTAGQTALSQFFGSVSSVANTLLPVLVQLAQAIIQFVLPGIGQLAAALAPVIAQLGTQLVSVIQQVSVMFPPLAQVVGALVSAFAPLIPVIGQIITTLLPPLLVIVSQLAPVIGQLSAVLGQALLGAALAIAPALAPIGLAFVAIVKALEPLLPAILNLAVQLLPPLLQIVVALAPGLVSFAQISADIAKTVVSLLTPALVGVADVLANVLAPVIRFLGPVLPAIAAGFLAWSVAQKALQIIQDAWALAKFVPFLITYVAQVNLIEIATKAWSAAQAILNVIMDANPIGIIIVALAALGVAIFEIVTHLSTLQAAWNTVWGAVSSFFTTVWNTIAATAQTVWNAIAGFFTGAWAAFSAAWSAFWNNELAGFQNIWTTLTSWAESTWNALAGFFTGAWAAFSAAWSAFWNAELAGYQNIWNTLVSWAEATWNALAGFFSAAWAAFSAAWSAFWNAALAFFQNLWNTLVSWAEATWNALAGFFNAAWAAWTAAWSAFWNAVLAFFQNIWNTLVSWVENTWNALAAFFNGAWAAFQAGWQAVWNAVSSFFQGIWNGIVSFAQSSWNTLSSWLISALNTFQGVFVGIWNAVSSALQAVWNGIVSAAQTIWHGVETAVAVPINFVIGTVLNNGLFKAWDAVVDFLHLPLHINNMPTIPGFSEGGYTGNGIFGTGGRQDPAGVVHAGEFVVNQEQTAQHLPLLQAINSGTAGYSAGGLVLADALAAGLPGYASGGIVGALGATWNSVTDVLGQLTNSLTGPIGSMLSKFTNSGFAQDLAGMAKSMLGGMWTSVKDQVGSLISGLLAAAKAALTTSFVGSVGGGAAQWKGLVDQVLTQLGVPLSADNGVLNIIAHESGGNPNAINLTDSNAAAGHPSQGLMQTIPSTFAAYAGPYAGRGITDPLANIYAGVNYALHTYGVGFLEAGGNRSASGAYLGYDTGGWLPPGASSVFNGTGQSELVLNPGQQANLHNMLIGGGSGGGGPATTPVWQFYLGDREITDLVDTRVTYWSNADARNLRSGWRG